MMSLVNVIIILLQQCPLGGFKLGRFANELGVEAQRVTGMFGFECTLYLNPTRNMDLVASTEQRLRMER